MANKGPYWRYEKLDDEGKIKTAPMNDLDGEITGKCILGLKAYFDENQEEAWRLGYTKHIAHDSEDANIAYNHQTQYLTRTIIQVDEHTVEDAFYVMDKSEKMMELEELQNHGYFSDIVFSI